MLLVSGVLLLLLLPWRVLLVCKILPWRELPLFVARRALIVLAAAHGGATRAVLSRSLNARRPFLATASPLILGSRLCICGLSLLDGAPVLLLARFQIGHGRSPDC